MPDIEVMEQRIAALERELAELKAQSRPGKKLGDPWARMDGIYANHPRFDAWQEAIAEYRREVDEREQIGEP